MFRKLENIPVCYIEDGIVYVLLDSRIHKQIIKIIKHLLNLNVNFYLTTPEISNPAGVIDLHEKVIRLYLTSYAKLEFYNGFKKIEFDMVDNLVKWSEKEKCYDLIKGVYLSVLKKVNHQSWDYYTGKRHFDYCQEIRDEFQSLYRHIQISKIL
jgi:hypothetical protein